MKKFILLLCLSSVLFADSRLKFSEKPVLTAPTLMEKRTLDFKIICVKGYQYLVMTESNDVTQMFKRTKDNKSVPISCDENKKEVK